MKKPLIYAKSTIDINNINIKEKIGCDGIELQLLSELLDKETGLFKRAEDVYDLQNTLRKNITAVHAPLFNYNGFPDLSLEYMVEEPNYRILDQTCYIANMAGEIHKRKIIVIVHLTSNLITIKMWGNTWQRLISAIDRILSKYPYVELAIENVTPLMSINDMVPTVGFRNNGLPDNIEVVRELRKELKTNRIGTVLDVCHAKITETFCSTLMPKYSKVFKDRKFDLESFFDLNQEFVKLFHYADTIDTGYGPNQHGIPFSENRANELFKLLDLYHKYDMTAPITLEVSEKNYLICDGYRISKRLLDEYYLEKK